MDTLAGGTTPAPARGVSSTSSEYRPRSPADAVLYQVVRDHFETFRARAATLRDGEGLPRVVERAFWTPVYLAAKTRKIAAAGLGSLILVVYRGLAVGDATSALESLVATTASCGSRRVRGQPTWCGRQSDARCRKPCV